MVEPVAGEFLAPSKSVMPDAASTAARNAATKDTGHSRDTSHKGHKMK